METAKGKLTNKTSGDELKFLVNPTDLKVDKQFTFAIEPRMGQSDPLLAFQSGGAKSLTFSLFFDKDIDSDCDIRTVVKFIQSLEVVEEGTKSVPIVRFQWGVLTTFEGYVDRYSYSPLRYDRKGEITSLKVEFSLLEGELGS